LTSQASRSPRFAILLPLLREQTQVAALLEHFDSVDYPRELVRIVPITTRVEVALSGQPTTQEVIEEWLRSHAPHMSICPMHFAGQTGNKASQLNHAISQIKMWRDFEPDYVCVFDADSRPDRSVLRQSAFAANAEELPPDAMQVACRFIAPDDASRMMRCEARRHTVKSLIAEVPVAPAASPRLPRLQTMVGHGEILRWDHACIAGFPADAVIDDLVTGASYSMARLEIRPVTGALDHASVPASTAEWIRQTMTWSRGLVSVRSATRHASALGATRLDRYAVSIKQLWIGLRWASRPARLISLIFLCRGSGKALLRTALICEVLSDISNAYKDESAYRHLAQTLDWDTERLKLSDWACSVLYRRVEAIGPMVTGLRWLVGQAPPVYKTER